MAVTHREDTEHLTILFEAAENGWIAARIEEFPGAISQGRTRDEARANVIQALRDLTHRPTPVTARHICEQLDVPEPRER